MSDENSQSSESLPLKGHAQEALRAAIQVYQLARQILVVSDDAEITRVLEKWRADAGGSIKTEHLALADLSAAVDIFDRLKEITSQARERLIAAGAKPLQ
jgi:hypothetical protein